MSGDRQKSGIVETEYYSFVDGLRGVAILMVVAVHTSQQVVPANEYLRTLAGSGARGVQLFFLLSAFTLFASSRQRMGLESSPRRNFYLRRAFRILPMWWIALIAFAASDVIGEDRGSLALNSALHSVFLFGFFPQYSNSLIPGGWSLFVEETFYLLLPLMMPRLFDVQRAAKTTVLLIAVALIWHVGASQLMEPTPTNQDFVLFFPFSQWFLFGMGVLLFFAVDAGGNKLFRGATALVADLLAVAFLASTLLGRLPGPPQFAVGFSMAAFSFAVSQTDSVLRRLVDNPVLRLFGRCCYSIYLFHLLIIHQLKDRQDEILETVGFAQGSSDQRFLVWFGIVATLCLAFGAFSFAMFEKPFVRLGRRVIRQLEARSISINAKTVV
jgi:peptidoglycan/LPS O-acetylase OafA/YrhL